MDELELKPEQIDEPKAESSSIPPELVESLAENAIYALPEYMEYDTYVGVLDFLETLHDQPVTIYCAGNGGSIDHSFAVVDLIRKHGNVTTVLAGAAYSANSSVFCAGATRLVSEHAYLAVHRPYVTLEGGNATLLLSHARNLERSTEAMARIYARAAKPVYDVQWWVRKMNNVKEGHFTRLRADRMIEMGMAQPLYDWTN